MKKPRGRKGGRKKKYLEPTTTVAFRVPLTKEALIKMLVKKELDKHKINK